MTAATVTTRNKNSVFLLCALLDALTDYHAARRERLRVEALFEELAGLLLGAAFAAAFVDAVESLDVEFVVTF